MGILQTYALWDIACTTLAWYQTLINPITPAPLLPQYPRHPLQPQHPPWPPPYPAPCDLRPGGYALSEGPGWGVAGTGLAQGPSGLRKTVCTRTGGPRADERLSSTEAMRHTHQETTLRRQEGV